MKNIVQVTLLIIIVVLGFLVYDSPNQKIRFEKEKKTRDVAVIKKLVDIRTAQVAFKDKYNRYTASFDTLISFIKNDSTPIIRKEGFLSDSAIEAGMTEQKAVKLGLIIRDTTYVPVFSDLFSKNYAADSMRYVPYNGNMEFEMETGVFVTSTNVNIKVFEARIPYTKYLNSLDKQEVDNLISYATKYERYPGIKVGSVQEANNNAGNWE